jgi:hypothetical protein
MRRYAAAILVVLFVSAAAICAGDAWVDKDWKVWSKDEVTIVLHDSPWSKHWAKGQVTTSAALPGVSGAGREGAAGANAPQIDYYLQIRSAMPVREAVIRDAQLDRSYDSMSDADKKAFDAQSAQFLNRVYSDAIVIHVLYSSNIQTFERQLAEHWQSIRPDAVPDDFYLINERGDRFSPSHFTSPKGGAYEFDMAFPRTVTGEPIIQPNDKTFQIQFVNPAVGRQVGTSTSGNGAPSAPASEASARRPGGNPNPVRQLPPTGGASTRPANTNAVPNFKAERVLVEFNVQNMMWKGKATY